MNKKIIALVFASIIFALTFYFIQKNDNEDVAKGSASKAAIESADVHNDLVYRNEQLGFQLNMTENWKEYTTVDLLKYEYEIFDAGVRFLAHAPGMRGEEDGLDDFVWEFNIIIQDEKKWREAGRNCWDQDLLCEIYSQELGRRDGKVYAYMRRTIESPGGTQSAMKKYVLISEDVEEIIKSFKFL